MPVAVGLDIAYSVEIAFVSDPYGTLTWTDVTSDVESFTTTRGRNYELAKTDPGTATIALDNSQGDYDPTNTASPYYPYVLPFRPVRIKASYAGLTYNVWRGFITAWPQTWAANGDRGMVTLTAVDAMKTVLGFTLGPRYTDLQATDPPIAQVLHANTASGTGEANPGTGGGTFTLTGTLTYHQPPAIGGSSDYSLDLGTGYIVTPAPLGATAAGFAGWFKVPAIKTDSSTAVIVSDWNSTAGAYGSRFAIEYGATAGAARFVLRAQNGAPGTRVTLTSTTVPVADTWYFLAFQFNSTGDKTATLWVNGTVEATATGLVSPSGSSGSTTYIGAQWNGSAAINLLGGSVDEVEFTPNDDAANLFTDRTILARYRAGIDAREAPEQDTGARISAVLDMVGWPAGMRSIDTGTVTLAATGSLSGKTALAVLQDAADAELGDVFIDGAGNFVFTNTNSRLAASVVDTFGDDTGETPYLGDITIDYDDAYIYNDIQVTQDGSSPLYLAEEVDDASIASYGLRPLQRSPGLANTADVDSQALTLLGWYSQPRPRVPQVSMEGVSTPSCLASMLGREIGDLVTVNRRPPNATAISIDCFIDGVSHAVTAEPAQWRTTFMLTPKLADALVYPGYEEGY